MANSSMFNLPSITAPSPNSLRVTVDSYSGLNPSRMRLAAWLGAPLVQKRSLIPIGMPHIGGASFVLIRSSAAVA